MTNDAREKTLLELEKKVNAYLRKRKAKKLARRISESIGGVVFLILAIITTYYAVVMIEDGIWYINPLTTAWNWWSDIITKPEQPWAIKMAVSFGIMYAIFIVINIIASLLVPLFCIGKAIDKSANKDYMQKLNSLENKLNTGSDSGILIGLAILHALVLTGSIMYIGFKTGEIRFDDFSHVFTDVMTFVFLLVLSLLISVILFGILILINNMFFTTKKPQALLDEVANLKKQEELRLEGERIERMKREREEKARLEAEEKKKQRKEREEKERKRQELLKQAESIYNKAMAGEEPDENLLEEAAKLGNPNACRYFGERYVLMWSTDEASPNEKTRILRKAERYLSVFAGGGDTIGEFLWILCDSLLNSHNYESWRKILSSLRRIEESGELPEQYEPIMDMLNSEAERMVEKTKPITNISSDPQGREAVYCKFRNGAICTKRSTSLTVAHCNYVNSPEQCSVALLENGLVFRWS